MRFCACLLALAAMPLFAADSAPQSITVRGKLIVRNGQASTIETSDHKRIALDADESTRKVISDGRLNGFEMEAKGRFVEPGKFLIDPIRSHAMLVRHEGSMKMVTYWCDVCLIRYRTRGPCVCCEKETTLDLRDPDGKDNE